MGGAIGTIQNKKIYITYDDSSNDVKIQGFLISIRKLSNNVIINDSNKLNECDIFIHLISNASIKNHNQLIIRAIRTRSEWRVPLNPLWKSFRIILTAN